MKMAAFNKVILIGNLTEDPELKQTPNGVSVTSFSLAVARKFNSNDTTPRTDFINIVAWRGTAEFITKYFEKGKSILIVGSLQSRSWADQTGQKRYVTEVVAEEAQFVEKKKESAPSIPYTPQSPQFEEMTSEEDLPF